MPNDIKGNKSEDLIFTLADAHVHIHNCFNIADLMQSAFRNFDKAKHVCKIQGKIGYVLFLTESADTDRFGKLRETASTCQAVLPGGFQFFLTPENNCLCVKSPQNQTLYIIAGRQIVSAERLEVLALGMERHFPDGRPLLTIIDQVAESKAIPVLPWGAGKWTGKRDAIIKQTVLDVHTRPLFLGDNGNRPFFWPLPALFAHAKKLGIANLPGSDPLPFDKEEQRVGSYGFCMPGLVRPNTVFQDLCFNMTRADTAIRTYGKQERLVPFLHHQIAMQLPRSRK